MICYNAAKRMSVSVETNERKEPYPEFYTMKISYANICLGETPWVALGNFMNNFFGYARGRRADLIAEAISMPLDATLEQQQWAVFCAASVEYLCKKYHLDCPPWVQNPSIVSLSEPWYHFPAALTNSAVRERLIRETPQEFACKNIYCGNRVYANKYEAAAELRQKNPPMKE